MSLGIAFKGAEGIVLAADSRVTLMGQIVLPNSPPTLLPSTFDNATKLLQVPCQPHIGAVTYGAGAIGQQQPRTAASFLPEFDASIATKGRLSVEDFAQELSNFFAQQWHSNNMPTDAPPNNDMVFLVGGYDEGATYGRIFQLSIPHSPKPSEWHSGALFGAVWGGQSEFIDRMVHGFDLRVPGLVHEVLTGDNKDKDKLFGPEFRAKLQTPIPWQFLPLQDCVDLSVFFIRTTIQLQQWIVGVRGVGGAIDVATITRTDGFKAIQLKQITGDKTHVLTAHR